MTAAVSSISFISEHQIFKISFAFFPTLPISHACRLIMFLTSLPLLALGVSLIDHAGASKTEDHCKCVSPQ
jgi:hypothetical protein